MRIIFRFMLICLFHQTNGNHKVVNDTKISTNNGNDVLVENSTQSNGNCSEDEYQCQYSLECIPIAWCCDHVIDCTDGTDEWPHFQYLNSNNSSGRQIGEMYNTTSVIATTNLMNRCDLCGAQYYQCPLTSECIPRGWLCDGQNDCGQSETGTDLSDEQHPMCQMIGQQSIETDISDNVQAMLSLLEPIKPYVAIYNRTHIVSLITSFVNVQQVQPIVRAAQNICRIIETSIDSRICWLDCIHSTIECSFTNQDQSINVTTMAHLPSYIDTSSIIKIHFNWITKNWIILNGKSELIYICTTHFDHCNVIADYTILSRPLTMELDPTEGLIFVSRYGDRSKVGPLSMGPAILKLMLDGLNKTTVLIDVRLVHPYLMSLDRTNRKLYWIDKFLGI